MSDDELDALVATLGETDWGPNVTDTMTRWDHARRKASAAITTLRARIAALEADRAQWASIPTMPIGKLFGWDEPTWRNVAKWAGNDWRDFTGPDHVEKRLLLRQRWLGAGGSMDGVTLPPAPPA